MRTFVLLLFVICICCVSLLHAHDTELILLILHTCVGSKIQIGFYLSGTVSRGSPGQRAVKWFCVGCSCINRTCIGTLGQKVKYEYFVNQNGEIS